MTLTISSQAEYERRELDDYTRQIQEVDRAPLADRKEGRKDFRGMIEDITLMTERIDWLLEGHFGDGAMIIARRIAANKRLNRAAGLSQMIAALECLCPANFARDAYNDLGEDDQIALNAAILIEADKERDS